ncbi:hypothetical protein L3X38_032253 [Prunus dulcis]|uniref:Uncharacterized protein n=1 Tax=Prunus dulcis TaxID=3755 RepID=A0AAD4YVR0_PRUDU|nr:hypothetical protein L3X38_032253 [Prunus dulcis]
MIANLSSHFTPNDLWIANSGASHHMTPNVHRLQASAPYSFEDKITIGNGEVSRMPESCGVRIAARVDFVSPKPARIAARVDLVSRRPTRIAVATRS